EFIVSWSAYGPSGRLQADDQTEATRAVRQALEGLGLHLRVERDPAFAGEVLVIKSKIPRYGDMGSFLVCVYPLGGRSWYDAAREQDQALKAQQEEESCHSATTTREAEPKS